MSESAHEIAAYTEAVLKRIPRAMLERGRVAEDVRTHLQERVEAGQSVRAALESMGPPEEVARAYLRELRVTMASPQRRAAAFAIDLALGALLVGPGVYLWLGSAFRPGEDGMPVALFVGMVSLAVLGLSAVVLSVLYFPALEACYGQTLGKRLLGLCVTTETGEQIGWGAAIVRRLPLLLEFFWLDALFALFTRRRQRAFDVLARTLVVRCA